METIERLVAQNESSRVEFKTEAVNTISLSEEIVAFANMDGGLLLIGVSDRGEVVGCSAAKMEERVINVCRHNIRPSLIPNLAIKQINDKDILVVEIKPGDSVHATIQGKYFIRVGSTKQTPTQQELLRLFQRRKLLQFDETPILKATCDQIDMAKVNTYLIRLGVSTLDTENKVALQRDLANLSILSTLVPEPKPTLAGLLAFDKYPQKIYPSYTIMCGAYQGDNLASEPIREKELSGPFSDLIEDALAFLKLTMPQSSHLVDGVRREETYLYPIKALREAIVNAVCHRDYTIEGSAIRLFLFNNRLEVRSPGSLPNTLTLESLPYRQFTRNQTIASFLAGLGYMERRGKGIIRMQKFSEENGVACFFSLTPDQAEFVVTFQVRNNSFDN